MIEGRTVTCIPCGYQHIKKGTRCFSNVDLLRKWGNTASSPVALSFCCFLDFVSSEGPKGLLFEEINMLVMSSNLLGSGVTLQDNTLLC